MITLGGLLTVNWPHYGHPVITLISLSFSIVHNSMLCILHCLFGIRTFGQWTVGQRTIGQRGLVKGRDVSCGQRTIGQRTIGQRTIGQRTIGQADEPSAE